MDAAATQARERFVSEDIFFDYDSAVLTADAQVILQDKAQWLKANPRVIVSIEGHTDERGTVAYNLALGNQRAENAKNFLIRLGVRAGSLRTVSYGEERPLDPGSGESAWSRNRRVHFEIR
jgi:peptidoglycan-associated lipoprotein